MTRALVVSGGGSKGAFAVGAIKKLSIVYPNLDYDFFVGTSTGSLIVPLVALNELALLEELYTTFKTSDIVRKFNLGDRLNEHSVFDTTPLWNLINKFYTNERYQALQDSGKKVYFAATCLNTSRLVVFTNDSNPVISKNYDLQFLTSADHFRKAVLASASQPVFMPPVKVNLRVPGEAHPNYQFADGGVLQYVGIEMAVDQGATEIFTVLLSTGNSEVVETEFKTIFPILQQTIDIFMQDVGKNDLLIPEQYNDALVYIDAVKKKMRRAGVSKEDIDNYFRIRGRENPFEEKVPLSIYIIRPRVPLGGGPGGLTFDPAEMKEMVKIGMRSSDEFIAGLDPADVTWA